MEIGPTGRSQQDPGGDGYIPVSPWPKCQHKKDAKGSSDEFKLKTTEETSHAGHC
jgi:hypothetical protein